MTKPNNTSTFKTSAYIITVNILFSKQVTWSRGVVIDTLLTVLVSTTKADGKVGWMCNSLQRGSEGWERL